jgi:hypothetical protein
MGLGARIIEKKGRLPQIAWRWDPETDILTGALKRAVKKGAPGLTGSVELEGADGSFILLDVVAGLIRGVEVVVWPDVRTTPALTPPADAKPGDVELPTRRPQSAVAAVEVDTILAIDTDADESVFHVRLSAVRPVTSVQVADGLIAEIDEHDELAGLWLTGVPAFPVLPDGDR